MMRPANIDQLSSPFESIGFNKERFLYWVNKRSGKVLSDKLIVVGIRRPRAVLGRPDSQEWVAFFLSKNKNNTNLKIDTHLVHASFNQELARKLSGFPDSILPVKKTLLIGAGAIGSAVADILVKSGCCSLKILDYDRLQPHNLSRHTLDHRFLGLKKAKALSDLYTRMFHDGTVCESIDKNILQYDPEKFVQFCEDVDLIVDCTASIAVIKYLSNIAELETPAISIYQINNGLSTFVLYSPNSGQTPLSLIELSAISKWRKNSNIINWLEESIKTVDIGGGCRSASAQIPYSHVLFGAASSISIILKWLSEGKLPESGACRLYQTPTVDTQEHLLKVENIQADSQCSDGWQIFTCGQVSDRLKELALQNPNVETGGILLGQVDRQRKILQIIECIETVGQKSESHFDRFPKNLKYKLAKIEKTTAGMLHYVGEWHTHPRGCKCQMSATDRQTMKKLAASLIGDRLPALCAISNGIDSNLHIIEK